MGKLHLASVIFIIVGIIAFIPLTVEIFGNMNTDVITVSACVLFVGLIGSFICTFIRGLKEWKNKKL